MSNEHEPQAGSTGTNVLGEAEDHQRQAAGTTPDAPAKVRARGTEPWDGTERRESCVQWGATFERRAQRDAATVLVGAECQLQSAE